MWPDSDEEPADDIDARDRKIARMIDEVKNVTLPSWVPVYYWESSPAPLPVGSTARQTAAQDEGNVGGCAWRRRWQHRGGGASRPRIRQAQGNVEDAHGVDDGSTGAAGHRVLVVPARRDVPAARGSVMQNPPQPPRPPTHTPQQEMEARLRAFGEETTAKLCAYKMCTLCGKKVSERHMKSACHFEKLTESALLDHLAGTVENIRVLTPCERKPVLTHPGHFLTRKRCREVWGDLLDYLPTRAEEKIRACEGFQLGRRVFVRYLHNNLRFELGMVTYNGTGKYSVTDVVAPWSDLPEDEGAFLQAGQLGISPHRLEKIASWWPVVCVDDAHAGTVTRTGIVDGKVVVIGIYQLMQRLPQAWEVMVIPMRRAQAS